MRDWIKCDDCGESWLVNVDMGRHIIDTGFCVRCRLSLEAKRYRWLRNNKHLDMWWSVAGPEDRNDNIDADIDDAMLNGV